MTAREFWKTSGHHLIAVTAAGELAPTADFVRAYFARSEMVPDAGACPRETALFESLAADPLQAVGPDMIAALADADARHNYTILLGFRDLLLCAGTLEAAYMKIVRGEAGIPVPPLFLDHIVHSVLRNILADIADPIRLRAAEVFFRTQNVSTDDGRVMLADDETVEMYAETGGKGGIGQLLAAAGAPARRIELTVLDEDNKETYWQRSDRFDMVIDFRFAQPALDAFARVIEAWVAHFLKITVRVQPVQRIDDDRWAWHIGLDAEASRILNMLYKGEDPSPGDLANIIALFRLTIADQDAVMPSVRGRPVYLGLARTGDGKLTMKPQNLIVNMPLKTGE